MPGLWPLHLFTPFIYLLQSKVKEYLEYIGFVPEILVSLIEEGTGGEVDIFERHKHVRRRELYDVLRADVDRSCAEARRHAYVTALALCVATGLTPEELSYS